MRHIYLSPHFDDAVYSCGGWLWQQAQAGAAVEVWTLCAGDPPAAKYSPFAQELHARWGLAGAAVVAARRAEDQAACARVGARGRYFDLPDAIYRREEGGEALYTSRAAIFGPLAAAERPLLRSLAADLASELEPTDSLYCPLALGNHVDHQLARRAAEQLARPLTFYADLPYVLDSEDGLAGLLPAGAHRAVHPLSEEALVAWAQAAAAYASQLSSFWPDAAALQAALSGYLARHGGLRLWAQEAIAHA